MSDAEQKKRDEKKVDEMARLASRAGKQERKDAATTPLDKLKYVFKIVRADPKNSFDFEDVADK